MCLYFNFEIWLAHPHANFFFFFFFKYCSVYIFDLKFPTSNFLVSVEILRFGEVEDRAVKKPTEENTSLHLKQYTLGSGRRGAGRFRPKAQMQNHFCLK